MPHALLFYGQHSIGKKALALELIKLLNCQYGNTAERPCQTCRACLDIGKNVYPDLLIVEPEEDKEIKISQVRALHDHLALRAYASSFKAVMIDRAHLLNQEAQSAFLKLLEEPKGSTIFILITEYPEMLLPTILSRVERLRFYHTEVQTFDQRQKKIIAELLEIIRQEMVLRFAYAKKLAEEPKRLKEILETWLGYFREILISAVHNHNKEYSLAKLSKILKLIQTTDFLIATTNVNARLALEILMLEL